MFSKFMEAKFRKVVTLHNWALSNAASSLLSSDMFWLYLVVRFYINVTNLHPLEE